MATGLIRSFGPLVQQRIQEMRRQAAVAVSEVVGPTTAAGDYPTRVSVLRREVSAAGSPSLGRAATWTTVSGLSSLVGHVRTAGKWADQRTGASIHLRDGEWIVMLADLPAGGAGDANELLPSDRMTWTDPVYGADAVFEIAEIHVRKPDGLCVAKCVYAREST